MKTAARLKSLSLRTRTFLDISEAAEQAGFSVRHFRRIIGTDRIPVMQIGRKFFVLDRDFRRWKATQGSRKS